MAVFWLIDKIRKANKTSALRKIPKPKSETDFIDKLKQHP